MCSSVVTCTFAYAVHFNSKIVLKDGGGVWGGSFASPHEERVKNKERLPFCNIHDILYIEGVACMLKRHKNFGVGVAENGV